MVKRILFSQLRKHDLDHDDSMVRELEMVVDGVISDPGQVIQFWSDVQIYGVEEAILYLGKLGPQVAEYWNTMKVRLK